MSKRNKNRNRFGQAPYGMPGMETGVPADEAPPADREPDAVSVPPPEPAPLIEPAYADAAVPPRREHCTYFAAGTVVEGTLRSDSDVEIVGNFSGEIMAGGKITIHANTVSSIAAEELELIGSTLVGDVTVSGGIALDEGSSITGNVRAANVDSAGAIMGNLTARDGITLRRRARVTGDIKTALLSTERGVRINGKVDMDQPP